MPVLSTELLILVVHGLSTLFMTGLIWFVQVVHYPLKAFVGAENYVQYQEKHMAKTAMVVGPPMIIEALCATWLVFHPPNQELQIHALFALILLCFIWISTALFSVPAHEKLGGGFNPSAHKKLVWTNWFRTIGWSMRSALALIFLVSV